MLIIVIISIRLNFQSQKLPKRSQSLVNDFRDTRTCVILIDTWTISALEVHYKGRMTERSLSLTNLFLQSIFTFQTNMWSLSNILWHNYTRHTTWPRYIAKKTKTEKKPYTQKQQHAGALICFSCNETVTLGHVSHIVHNLVRSTLPEFATLRPAHGFHKFDKYSNLSY